MPRGRWVRASALEARLRAEALNDTRWHRYCHAFQAGFVGVFTSYTFMTEQSATLTAVHGTLYGAAYVVATMAAAEARGGGEHELVRAAEDESAVVVHGACPDGIRAPVGERSSTGEVA
mgnify:CR=1 FL=1